MSRIYRIEWCGGKVLYELDFTSKLGLKETIKYSIKEICNKLGIKDNVWFSVIDNKTNDFIAEYNAYKDIFKFNCHFKYVEYREKIRQRHNIGGR